MEERRRKHKIAIDAFELIRCTLMHFRNAEIAPYKCKNRPIGPSNIIIQKPTHQALQKPLGVPLVYA